MDVLSLFQGCGVTMRRQFTFTHTKLPEVPGTYIGKSHLMMPIHVKKIKFRICHKNIG